jgi:hypothetical protein
MTKPTGFILFVLVIAFSDFAFAQGITPPAKGAPPLQHPPRPRSSHLMCARMCALANPTPRFQKAIAAF